MHSYLRAIGFSEIKNETDMEKLLDEVFHDYTEREIARGENKTVFIQMKKEYATDMGITICGSLDENGFHRQYYFPYFNGAKVTPIDDVTLERRVDGVSYAGVCENCHIGVSIIFYLQNTAEYQREEVMNKIYKRKVTATLAGLSNNGMVLFPIQKDNHQLNQQHRMTERHSKLMSAAKNGDEEAIESLTIEDMDTYSMISRRMYSEDVYSIVDTFFMPYGIECDQYQIMGNIEYCKKVENSDTKEKIYLMNIECNDLLFDVCINEKDLLGEPEVGRRFKGNIWLQGKIQFE